MGAKAGTCTLLSSMVQERGGAGRSVKFQALAFTLLYLCLADSTLNLDVGIYTLPLFPSLSLSSLVFGVFGGA